MERWVMSGKRADFPKIAKDFNISLIMARLLRNKDLTEYDQMEKYLHPTLQNLHNPRLMKDMEKGVFLLRDKIKLQEKIRVIGDYDIDGIIGTYLLVSALERCGANVDFDIPDRVKDGYGINNNLISRAAEDGISTIITCDNGIAALEAVDFAKQKGLTVIITDHHEIPYEENAGEKIYLQTGADAVINPKQEECRYPFKGICGAVVAYKLVEVLYEEFSVPKSECCQWLPFAAFATIGDVMDLMDENRTIVKYGLQQIKQTEHVGLQSLITVNQIELAKINTYHVGFVLGPCMNAAGRLDTAKRAISLLRERDRVLAETYAGDLKALNDSRKALTLKELEAAVAQIEEKELAKDKIIVVYLPECHESIAGIIAGRIKESYHKPVYVLTKSEEGIKGSGRSIETYSMYEELHKCKDLLTKFGGHKMAAGLSLTEERLEEFRKRINDNCTLTEEDFLKKIYIDMRLPVSYVTESLIRELALLEPFGKGNERPLFGDKNLQVVNAKILGANKNVLRLVLKDENGCRINGIYFGNTEAFQSYIKEKFGEDEWKKMYLGRKNEIRLDLTYFPEVNAYNGHNTIQIHIYNYQ